MPRSETALLRVPKVVCFAFSFAFSELVQGSVVSSLEKCTQWQEAVEARQVSVTTSQNVIRVSSLWGI